jgi:hypothetical protein
MKSEWVMTAPFCSRFVSLHLGWWNPASGSMVNDGWPARRNCQEDIEMVRKALFSSIGHAAVIAIFAAVTLTAIVPAVAETGPSGNGLTAAPATRDATDVSARRRVHHGGHPAAAATGAELAIVSPQNRRAYDDGDYECTPVHCGPSYKRGAPNGGYGTPIFVVPSW